MTMVCNLSILLRVDSIELTNMSKQQIDARDQVIQLEVMLADAKEKANSEHVVLALQEAIIFIKDMYDLKQCKDCERVKEQQDFINSDSCVTCCALARQQRQSDEKDYQSRNFN